MQPGSSHRYTNQEWDSLHIVDNILFRERVSAQFSKIPRQAKILGNKKTPNQEPLLYIPHVLFCLWVSILKNKC